ncbi:hypothetical protein EHS25_001870 [Saitozyma podzolica]|jgi:hypothetical protein|uniref:Uncharacterized protein n=1 Tax=Saitozyma podzolica TaxID=1890683 RepID=A0A427YG36_9TREE|nr:hypothetical protein EHS25_001870 [Saitozyma podzolica]
MVIGLAATELSSEDIDIAIICMISQDPQPTTLPLAPTGDDSAAQRTAALFQKHLEGKKNWPSPSDRPFRPLVLSLSGKMEREDRDA